MICWFCRPYAFGGVGHRPHDRADRSGGVCDPCRDLLDHFMNWLHTPERRVAAA